MNDEPTPQDLMRYDVLTQEALRSVIKKVLDEVVTAGLPGDHHFFISFNTNHPGVRLSMRMREQYPEAMTIVIQHSFWNLETNDTGFEIDLSFNEIPERLRVPYASILSFFDPSVKFGLQFDEPVEEPEEKETKRPKLAAVKNTEEEKPVVEIKKEKPASKSASSKSNKKTAEKKEPAVEKETAELEENSADVVSLDAFRKK